VPCRSRLFGALALVPVLALALGVAPAGAQPGRPRFEVVPRVGALYSLMDLGKSRDIITLWQASVELKPAFTAGLIAQYNPPYLPVSFRLAFDYTLFGATSEAQLLACDVLGGPACAEIGVDTRYMVLSGDVLIRAGEAEESRFYLMVGLGIKRYEFGEIACDPVDPEDLVCELLDNFTHDQTNPMVHLGLGFNFRVGPARLELELADYMSTFRPAGGDTSGEVQQDLMLSLGVRLGVL
jgi:hypothetical protein